MKPFLRALGSIALALLLAVGASADTIYMKNGSVIRGTVIGFQDGVFTVQLAAAPGNSRSRAMLAGDEIERIEFEGDAGDPGSAGPADPGYDSRPATAQPSERASSRTPDAGGTPPTASPRRDTATDPVPVSRTGERADPASPDDFVTRQAEVTIEPKADWTNSGLRVRKGTRVRIQASGSLQLDSTGRRVAGPGGVEAPDRDKLIPNRPTGSLIAVIGDDNDEFIYVGSQAEFVAGRNGYLFLGVNEGNLTDNSGGFKVQLTVEKPPRENVAGGGGGGGGRKKNQNNPDAVAANRPQPRPADPDPQPPEPGGYDAGTPDNSSAPPVDPDPEPGAGSPGTNGSPSDSENDYGASRTQPPAATGSVLREADVTVQSTLDWTNTKIRVQRGNRIRITANGSVQLDKTGRYASGPAGLNISDNDKLIPSRPTGSLIAVIGDDNDEFVYIGQRADFTASRDGILFLSVNEGNLRDNSGSFQARVTVEQVQITAPNPATTSKAPSTSGGTTARGTQPGSRPQGNQSTPRSSSSGSLPKPVVDEAMGGSVAAPKPPSIGPNGGQADVTLQAKSDWTSTQVTVKKGMKIRISATGTVKIEAAGQAVTPAGTNRPDSHKLIADKPTGALIAVIGDDNNDYIFIGTQAEFVAQRDGLLFLGLNEGTLSDNSGYFTIRVVVGPAGR